MKNCKLCIVSMILLVMAAGTVACAAPNIFGVSGGLEMPNDVILPPGTFDIGYHFGINVGGTDDDSTDTHFITAGVGVLPNLEVSLGFIVPQDGDTSVLPNAKYRIWAETVDRPAVTVGVVDAVSDLRADPGLFILVSKSLTSAAEDITGKPSRPLRGHIGLGSGIYRGILFGLDWTMTPKFQLGFEYLNRGLEDKDPNLYGRYALTRDVRLDAGTIAFDSFLVGISYTAPRF